MRGNLSDVAAVIFDLDGTLYDQHALRRRMAVDLVCHHVLRPWRIGDVRILLAFRRQRERHAGEEPKDLEAAQFAWTSRTLRVSPERVRRVVERWMYREPLRHLRACLRPEVPVLLSRLSGAGIRTAVVSDYPAREKLAVLGLQVECVVSALDPDVNRLKPHPRGLLVAAARVGVMPGHCFVVGDRDDRDGAAARAAGMRYAILDRRGRGASVWRSLDELLLRPRCGWRPAW